MDKFVKKKDMYVIKRDISDTGVRGVGLWSPKLACNLLILLRSNFSLSMIFIFSPLGTKAGPFRPLAVEAIERATEARGRSGAVPPWWLISARKTDFGDGLRGRHGVSVATAPSGSLTAADCFGGKEKDLSSVQLYTAIGAARTALRGPREPGRGERGLRALGGLCGALRACRTLLGPL